MARQPKFRKKGVRHLFQPNKGVRHLFGVRDRVGSVTVEVVLAATLLATAGVGLSKLVGRSQIVARQTDQRLAAKLIAGNVIERFKATDADQMEIIAEPLQRSAIESSGYDVRVTVEPMRKSDGGASGKHVRVEVVAGDAVRVVMHDWRLQMDQPSQRTELHPVAPETGK